VGWGLAAAMIASVCYGIASVLQAVGARRVERGEGVDPRLLVRVLGSLPFVAGTALDGLGLIFDLFALRTLPLFTVQAVVNTNLAVTAVVAVIALKARLTRRDKAAVSAVVAGLLLLGVASGPEGTGSFDTAQRYGLLVAAIVLAAVAIIVGNVYRRAHSAVLGALAGFMFGLFGISVRVLPSLEPARLLTEPALYAGVISSVTGFLFFTTALQRGSVTAATAALVVGETTVPALVGLLMLGDSTRHGFAAVGVVGFLFAVGGALALSRYGEPTADEPVPGGRTPSAPSLSS
jgi:drug/metabolite transporter (DMT)-like permease